MGMMIQRTKPFMIIMPFNVVTPSSVALSMTIVWHILCIIATPRRSQSKKLLDCKWGSFLCECSNRGWWAIISRRITFSSMMYLISIIWGMFFTNVSVNTVSSILNIWSIWLKMNTKSKLSNDFWCLIQFLKQLDWEILGFKLKVQKQLELLYSFVLSPKNVVFSEKIIKISPASFETKIGLKMSPM